MIASWGNVVRGEHELLEWRDRFGPLPAIPPAKTVLPFGNGRSYGDSCLNVGEALLPTRALDRFIEFDALSGLLTCEPGVLLGDILNLVIPQGWFLPVVPGTQLVTVAGAIANDVHGKNHHRNGTFGRFVRQFELLRSAGERLICSPQENPQWFAATIGGLGLTGVISWAQLQLKRIAGPWLKLETLRCPDLNDLFDLSESSAESFEYTVAWVDCLARGRHLGRGLFQRAMHSAASERLKPHRHGGLSVPLMPPVSLVNPASLRLFNTLHYHRQRARQRRCIQHYQPFFFPLDTIQNWNRIYGPRGFYQYQCVVPTALAREAIRELLERIAASRMGSFLTVLKQCGASQSPGLLSFPMPGFTLALDFPNQSPRTEQLFAQLDGVVAAAGGRLYPAKDGRMPAELFRSGYPRWREFAKFVDPRFSSTFWRRVSEQPH